MTALQTLALMILCFLLGHLVGTADEQSKMRNQKIEKALGSLNAPNHP